MRKQSFSLLKTIQYVKSYNQVIDVNLVRWPLWFLLKNLQSICHDVPRLNLNQSTQATCQIGVAHVLHARKMFPAFAVHAQPATLHIWKRPVLPLGTIWVEYHCTCQAFHQSATQRMKSHNWDFSQCCYTHHFNEVERGLYWFHLVRLWTESCPLCIFNNTCRIHFIFAHLIKQLQKVCRV